MPLSGREQSHAIPTRRSLLQGWLAASATGISGISMGMFAPILRAQPIKRDITPSCGSDDEPTRSSTEGPFYSNQPPEKSDFRGDADGDPVTLIGFVLTRDCQPISGAIVDLWHANRDGEYDNRGFRLRGYQKTDADGRYFFVTIRPAEYGSRTPHYHVKVRNGDDRVLTTQLYFPGEARNERDFLFNPALLMDVQKASDGDIARFDFVLS